MAFHAGDDAFADHFAFEFGEGAQHLEHGAPGGGGGVEGFGGGDERHAEFGEFFDQCHEVALAAGEPVHFDHQQHVNPVCAGGGERGLQTGSVGVFGGGVVGERRGLAPPGLGGDVVIQPNELCVEGIGLVFFVGRSPQVDTYPLVPSFGFGT